MLGAAALAGGLDPRAELADEAFHRAGVGPEFRAVGADLGRKNLHAVTGRTQAPRRGRSVAHDGDYPASSRRRPTPARLRPRRAVPTARSDLRRVAQILEDALDGGPRAAVAAGRAVGGDGGLAGIRAVRLGPRLHVCRVGRVLGAALAVPLPPARALPGWHDRGRRTRTGRPSSTSWSITFPARVGFIMRQIDAFRETRLRIGVAGFAGLTWASLGFFGAVSTAVNYAWGVETPRSFLKHRLFAFLHAAGGRTLFVVAVVLTSAGPLIQTTWFAQVLQRFAGLAWSWGSWRGRCRRCCSLSCWGSSTTSSPIPTCGSATSGWARCWQAWSGGWCLPPSRWYLGDFRASIASTGRSPRWWCSCSGSTCRRW